MLRFLLVALCATPLNAFALPAKLQQAQKTLLKLNGGDDSSRVSHGAVVCGIVAQLSDSTSYFDAARRSKISQAVAFAEKAHSGQRRKSGEPFIIHPLETALILADLRMDCDTVVAGLLHDTVEDTSVTLLDISQLFGADVATLVRGVTDSSVQKQRENQRSFFLAVGLEWRTAVVKLADRLHNMRTLEHMPQVKQVRKAEETMLLFVPLARSLGLRKIECELRALSARYLNPSCPAVLRSVPGAAQLLELLALHRFPSALDDFLRGDEALQHVGGKLVDHRAKWLQHERAAAAV
ncbi:hypothetical protein M885DRAFT_531960 [Pelagophyceae sp. CCMP2097]|nr:hypothetical protein M885DRAFT_531960 [Pelagophyceae sp. CCMP2097]